MLTKTSPYTTFLPTTHTPMYLYIIIHCTHSCTILENLVYVLAGSRSFLRTSKLKSMPHGICHVSTSIRMRVRKRQWHIILHAEVAVLNVRESTRTQKSVYVCKHQRIKEKRKELKQNNKCFVSILIFLVMSCYGVAHIREWLRHQIPTEGVRTIEQFRCFT